MKTFIICDFSCNDLWNFISDDDTDEFLKIWTDDVCSTNTDVSTSERAESFRKKTHSKIQLSLDSAFKIPSRKNPFGPAAEFSYHHVF